MRFLCQMDLVKGTKCSHSAVATQEGTQPQRLQGCCFIRDGDTVATEEDPEWTSQEPHLHREAPTLTRGISSLSPELTLSGLEQTVLVVSWCYSNTNDPEGRSHTGQKIHL